MASLDSYLHIIGIELLAMLAIFLSLLDSQVHKRALSMGFMAVLGFMLAHFATHLLPSKIAAFIYSSHHEYRSLKSSGYDRT